MRYLGAVRFSGQRAVPLVLPELLMVALPQRLRRYFATYLFEQETGHLSIAVCDD